MTAWFGDSWSAPFNDDHPRVRTPVGEPCAGCPEPIGEADAGVLTTCTGVDLVVSWLAYHLECWLMLAIPCHMSPPKPLAGFDRWQERVLELDRGVKLGHWSPAWARIALGRCRPRMFLAYIFPRRLGWLHPAAARMRKQDERLWPWKGPWPFPSSAIPPHVPSMLVALGRCPVCGARLAPGTTVRLGRVGPVCPQHGGVPS